MLFHKPRSRQGLTLVETLVLVAMIGTGLGMLVAGVEGLRQAGHKTQCANQLRQLGLASLHCQNVHGRLPPAVGWFPTFSINGSSGIGPVFFHLLPYLEQEDLYRSSAFQSAAPVQSYFDFQRIGSKRVGLWNCPADPSTPGEGGAPQVTPAAASSYAANFLIFGQVQSDHSFKGINGRPSLPDSVPDGVSNTILFGEKYAMSYLPASLSLNGQAQSGGCHWDYWGLPNYTAFFALYWPGKTASNAIGPASRFQARPNPNRTHPALCASGHRSMNAAMADGSVRSLSPGIEPNLWWALATPAGADRVE